jgi:hypothetical protein
MSERAKPLGIQLITLVKSTFLMRLACLVNALQAVLAHREFTGGVEGSC